MSPGLWVLSLMTTRILRNILLSESPKHIGVTVLEYIKIRSSVALELFGHYL